jgi:hypothetical protein
MSKVRIIKRKDGVIQTQHRGDERYDDSTLPSGTGPDDVAEEVLVDEKEMEDVEDTQAQLDIKGGQLVKDLDRKPMHEEIAERRAAAAAVFDKLDEDEAVDPALKKYLGALRDHLNIGASRIERRQPPVLDRLPVVRGGS